jgi:hypothetical protein
MPTVLKTSLLLVCAAASCIWSSWRGKTVTATLYEATMLANALTQGPYPAAPLSFQLTP